MNESWSAVVTGGGSGLGAAVVAMLAGRGAAVVSLDLRHPRPGPEYAATVTGSVTEADAVAEAVNAAVRIAPLRAGVACAGVVTPGRVLRSGAAGSQEAFERVVGINLSGTYNTVRLCAEAMHRNLPDPDDRGVLVLTSSVAAYDGQVGQAAYSAAKAGIAGMTLPLARELGDHRIRVVSIAPGMFDTPLLAGLPQETRDGLAENVPHPRRLGDPVEFAALVGHVLDNKLLNGETIRLDGALRMTAR